VPGGTALALRRKEEAEDVSVATLYHALVRVFCALFSFFMHPKKKKCSVCFVPFPHTIGVWWCDAGGCRAAQLLVGGH
jgi:hypothetical protein